MNDTAAPLGYSSVVLANDEGTDLDFVVQLLRHVLGKGDLEAREIARMAGWIGRYACGTYPTPVAEAFVAEAARYAQMHRSALRLQVQPVLEDGDGVAACSFCGQKAAQVRTMLSGKNAAICDGCVLRGAAALSSAAPHERFNHVHELLEWHFAGIPKEDLASSNRSFPERVRADLQRAADGIFAREAVKAVGLHGGYDYEQTTITTLLQRDRNARTIGPLRYHDVDIGEDEPVACLENALWLMKLDGLPIAVLLCRQRQMQGTATINVEIATRAGDTGRQAIEGFFRKLEQAVQRAGSYRGKVLSFEQSDMYSGMATGILVHRLPPVEREEVILPARTLELLERNVVRFARHRAAMAKLGQSAKKGLLFHGPPGTGKTHTVRYLASALPGHTTLLITSEQVGLLAEYFTLARLLQPSIIVIEDADLIARDRSTMESPCEEVLLNKLLNEMDGLKQDAEVFFILTTNRPEMLEAALASRPGRVDQAIEFPLPDADCRRKLVRLYGRGLTLAGELLETMVKQTAGVSASFIKELMRRSAQYNVERGGAGELSAADCASALEEMLFAGGRLNRQLLGSDGAVSPGGN
ncbi:MAG TPA: ATP-dependent Clp protease adaptor ClpS [Usitatibacter sp.]|nr:ATP-dependent Clp protease adaptor ClpS [Usitatibacter sp.]